MLDLDLDLDLDLETQNDVGDGLRLTQRIVSNDDHISFEPSGDYAENARMSVEGLQALGAKKEKAAVGKVVKDARNAQKRMEANTDQSYYFTMVFLDSYQAEAFMKALGLDKFSDSSWSVDGLAAARAMGIELPESHYAPYDLEAGDRKLADLSFDIDGDYS